MSPLTTTVGFSTEATLSKHNTLSITRCNHVEGQPKNELSVRFDGECEQGSPVCCVETHECVRIVVRCARREWGVPKESGSGEESAKGILQIHNGEGITGMVQDWAVLQVVVAASAEPQS